MTNLERYQSMTAEEFANEFHSSLCEKTVCVGDKVPCEACVLNHLEAEYKEKDDDRT